VDRLQIARECFAAYESGDRSLVERHLADDFRFYSPADPGIDRERYFERCWPNAERIASFAFGDKVSRVEVYFGWDLPA
jgi:ketosteroid isomerase-like protein